ncbi:MAG: homocitrate synthase/isopropylmalate synthase family protein, partial [Burkholderiales bacterium]
AKAGLRARIGAHARCALDDVKLALDCGIGFLGVFLSVSDRRLRLDYRIELGEAIERVRSIVAYAKTSDPSLMIRYTPEDAVRSSFDDVVAVTAAATEAGADIISVADTTGAMSPLLGARSLPRYVRRLRRALAAKRLFPRIEVHCHNDRGLALANALHACAAGADVVDAAVLGLGERAGIVDLAELLVNLRELFPDRAGSWRLARIMALYEFVSESSYRPIPDHRPVVGKYAFTHYSGIHVRAVSEDPVIYQSLDPELVGRNWTLSLGPQSGSRSVELALKLIDREDLAEDKELVSEVLAEIKTLTKSGVAMDVHREFLSVVWRHEKAKACAWRKALHRAVARLD